MSLLEQPGEIIIEQLRYLPLQDLLNVCQTNLLISEICRGRRLWELRLIDDFKMTDLTYVLDPRSYYFSLLGGRNTILDHILNDITQDYFDRHSGDWSDTDIDTYTDFVNIQREQVNRLTGQEIELLTNMFRVFSDRGRIFHAGQCGPDLLTSIFFDASGTLFFTSTEE